MVTLGVEMLAYKPGPRAAAMKELGIQGWSGLHEIP